MNDLQASPLDFGFPTGICCMSLSSNPQRVAVLALIGTIGLWAYSWIVMKQVLTYAGPFDFAALRYLIGAGVLFLALLLTRQSLQPPPLLPTIVIGLFQTAAFQGMEQWALLEGGAGHVALLAYTMPFWAVLLAWWLLSEKPSARQWLGLGFAATGLFFIMAPWHAMGSLHSTLIALLGGLAWAVGTVLSKRMFRRHSPSVLALTAWQMLVGGLALGLLALLVPQRTIEWNAAFIGGLAYCAVLASSVAWWLWSLVLNRLPTTVASVSSLGVPIISVLLAWAILHDRPSWSDVVGIVFVVFGVIAVSGFGSRRRQPAAAERDTPGAEQN